MGDARERSQCDDPDVEAIIEASTGSVEWLGEEFSGVDLGDKRLDRRLIKTAELLGKSPVSPINEACGDWASTQAAYRLFDNGKASPEAIREPHSAATVKRMVACGGPVLVAQDTVFFSYGRHPKTRGLGPIGKSNAAHDRGLIMHNALAFTASGVPLGILSQTIWARDEVPEEEFVEKVLRLQCTAIQEKESSKWLVALRDTIARTPRGVQVVTIADRESDFFEFLTAAKELRARYVIRARRDHVRVHKALPPATPPTLREVVRLIGRVGGHLGRTCDGEPGMTVLWRGWMRLYEDVLVLRAHKQALGLADSS